MLTELKKQGGFTLIELMIVIAIIGILAAIAVPQFGFYRKRSYNTAAHSDLKNFTTAQEAYFVDELTYCSSPTALTGSYGAFTSDGVTVTINTAGINTYGMVARHSLGDKTYHILGPGGSIAAL
jgi:type IV pilus assembly protein PilA